MLRLRSLGSSQNLKGQIYFRIMPTTIKMTTPSIDLSTKWLLYLEKGMQILGKTNVFEITASQGEYYFENGLGSMANKFDFQIVEKEKDKEREKEKEKKNMIYTWALYSLDSEEMEQRVGSETFSIKEYYEKYDKQCVRNGYDLTITIKNFNLNFKLFIQNTSNNITELVNGVVPENQDDVTKALIGLGKKGESAIKDRRLSSAISMEKEKEKAEKQKENNKEKQKEKENENENENEKEKQKQKQKQKQLQSVKSIKKVSLKIEPDPEPQPQAEQKKQPESIPQQQKAPQPQPQPSPEQPQPTQPKKHQQTRPKQIEVNSDSSKLEAIAEDKEKEDLHTPVAHGFEAGSFNEAIAEVVAGGDEGRSKKEELEEMEEKLRGWEKRQEGEAPVFAASTPDPDQNLPQQPQKPTKSVPKTSKSKLKTTQPEPQTPTPTDSGLKFKKLIIVFLLLVLIAGIMVPLMSKKQDQDAEEQQDRITSNTGKGKKKMVKKIKNKV